jgi:hypothetical protein
MEAQALFENIDESVQQEIRKAKRTIFISVSDFTNEILFRELIVKAEENCEVTIFLKDNTLPFDYEKEGLSSFLSIHKCQLDEYSRLQNNFCLIDNYLLITGSYPIAQKEINDLDFILITNDNVVLLEHFFRIINERLNEVKNENSTCKNLKSNEEIINFLQELKIALVNRKHEELKLLNTKLEAFNFNKNVEKILFAIDFNKFSDAENAIDQYLKNLNELTLWNNPNIEKLKREIQILDIHLIELDLKKGNIENLLQNFQRRHLLEVGPFILQIFTLKKILHRNDRDKIEEIEMDEREYNREYEDEKSKKILILSEDERKKISRSYRKAVILCHPDKFVNESLEVLKIAESIMIELAKAKENGDLDKINELLEILESGNLFEVQSSEFSNEDEFLPVIQKYNAEIKKMISDISAITKSHDYLTIMNISNWDDYFENVKEILKKEIETLEILVNK